MKINILKKNDKGNGYSLNIPFAVLTLLFTLIISLIPVVFAYGVLNERVTNLQSDYDLDKPDVVIKINNIEDRLIVLEKIAAGTEVSLLSIQSDISEIKSDVKDVRRDMLR